jgi:hypothetical protein
VREHTLGHIDHALAVWSPPVRGPAERIVERERKRELTDGLDACVSTRSDTSIMPSHSGTSDPMGCRAA